MAKKDRKRDRKSIGKRRKPTDESRQHRRQEAMPYERKSRSDREPPAREEYDEEGYKESHKVTHHKVIHNDTKEDPGPRTGPAAFLKRVGAGPDGGRSERRSGFDRRASDRRGNDRPQSGSDRGERGDRGDHGDRGHRNKFDRIERAPTPRSSRNDPYASRRSAPRHDAEKESGGQRRSSGRPSSYGAPSSPRTASSKSQFYEREPLASRGGSRGRGDRKRRDEKFVIIHGEVQKNSRGFAFLLHKPEDIFIPPHFAQKLLTGDTVKATINPRNKELIHLEIASRMLKSFIGTYEAGFSSRTVVLSDRTMREEVAIIEPPNIAGLRHGDKVLVEITRYEPRLEGRITRTFGATLAPKFDTFSVVVKSQWPQEFSREAQDDATRLSDEIQKSAAASGYKGRKDFRTKPFVTIDGKDARDFDDAVLVEKTSSGYVLYVAIADVSEFVIPGTKLDDEAYARSTSVYFPEWVIPMLPEALSNGACSLRPNEEKLTLCCEMHYDANGRKRSAKVYEAVIRSHRRCIYEEIEKEARAGEEFWKEPYDLYRKIRESRNRRGALDLDLPESKIVLDENGDTIDIRKVERVDAHRLIEEFMIAANESVTEIMEREGWPFVYRVHEPPKVDALERFERFAIALGLKPKLGGGTDPKLFARFIDSLKENPYATTLYYLMLRSLKQARYDAVNLKHFGLASQAYTHFTSPIRRYPDLMVHRILKKWIRRDNFENDEQMQAYTDDLVDACDHCSKLERKAEDLDRTVTKVKKARFMAKHMGEEFEARITNCNENGVYIELQKWFVDGLIPIAELGGDYFEFVEERMMLKGKRTGKKYKIGDSIHVSVLRTDIDNGYIDFTLTENIASLEEDNE